MARIATQSAITQEKNAIEFLQTASLFIGADEEILHRFLKCSNTKHYGKGKLLFIHEDSAEYFYIIASGWVKLFRETLGGDEAVIDILTTGHTFGETSVFEENLYTYSAQIVENAELIAIPTRLLKQEVENNQKLALSMLSSMTRYRKQQEKEIEHLTVQNAPQRIGCFLLKLCFGKENNSPIVLQLPYDKILIAARLGMQPETFSRALATLKHKTGIKVHGPTVTINNVKQLTDYCCGFCSDSYPCENIGE